MSEPTKLLDRGTFFEGPRWHEGNWWVSDFYTDGGRIVAVDPGGRVVREIALEQPSGLGWLPNGDLLAVSMSTHKIWRIAPGDDNAEPVLHADLAGHSRGESNDMTVDAQGRVWVDSFGYDLYAGERPVGAELWRVEPDGTLVTVADGLHFPNSIMVSAAGDRLVVAETIASRLTAFDVAADGTLSGRREWAKLHGAVPDGICLDAEGAIWSACPLTGRVLRVREGGEVTDVVAVDRRGAYACMLGGPDRTTLHVCTADASDPAATGPMRGAIEVCEVTVPGAGLP